jgi:integrase
VSEQIDWKLPGFGKRIRNGKLSWIFQYKLDGKNRKIKLGGPELSEAQARKLYQAAKGKLSTARLGHGLDPATERDKRRAEAAPQAKAARTFASIVPLYLNARRDGIKPATYELQERYLNSHWKALHGLPLDGTTRADVAASLTTITKDSGPVAANRARSTLSKFYVWAIGEGLCDNNPVVGTNKRDENDPRDRSLSDAEAAAIWLGAADSDYGRILKLLLLTGSRRSEIGDLKWGEITDARPDLPNGRYQIELPKTRTKNHQAHIVPLSDAAMSILTGIERRDREYVFGRSRAGGFCGWSKGKTDFDKAVELKEPWTVHDLRRTVRTGLGQLGVQPHIAEAVLNHIPPKLIRTYDRNKYESEKRAALDKWAAHLKLIVAQATGANVTALHNRDSAGGKKR